jgi:CHAT domain-containing protein/tetratricopeptide (TPR) repeat protein
MGRKMPVRDVIVSVLIVALLATNVLLSRLASAQSVPTTVTTAYEADTQLADRLMRDGKFAEAAVAAVRAAEAAEALHGPDTVETAVALHNLGFILKRDKRPDEARLALERAVSIYQAKLSAVHGDTSNAIGELGEIYIANGRGADLAALYARLIERAAREGYGEHINVAHMLANQGFVLRGLKREHESEAAFERAVALYEQNGQTSTKSYHQTLEALLERFDTTNRDAEMIARAKAAIDRLDVSKPASLGAVIAIHGRLSRAALDAGRSADARTEAEAALALIEANGSTLPPTPPGQLEPTVTALNNLARAHRAAANYSGAETAYRRAIKLLDVRGDTVNAGIVTDNLAVLYLHQGRNAEAERYNKQALALLEAGLGRNHPSVGRAAANLGTLLSDSGRHAEAEPLLLRAIAIAEAQPDKDAVSIGIYRDNLAGLYRMTERHAQARTQYQLALGLFEGVLPPTHPRLATTHNNLGRYFLDLRQYDHAETELKRALAQSEQIYGADSFAIAVPAANLAEVYTATKRYAEARQLFQRALAVLETVHGPRHGNLLITLTSAAELELADGQLEAARTLFERAVGIELQERSRSGLRAEPTGSRGSSGGRALTGLMQALWQDGKASGRPDMARALELGQWETATPAATALAALGARAGVSDPALGALTRERQDLAAEWQATDKRLTQLLSQSEGRDDAQEHQLRTRLAAIDSRLAAIDTDLGKRYPRYLELAQPTPLDVSAVRRLLAPSEAAIQFTVADDATHVIAVTSNAIRWHRAPISRGELRTLVANLRCGLDRAEWTADGGKRCARLLGIDPARAPGPRDPLPFDLTGAHALYGILLEPLSTTIAGKDLLVVVSSALTSLPLHVLVAEKPAGREERVMIDKRTNLAKVAWLARRHAITVLPSLASLSPLRQLTKANAGKQPYLGFGNPLLTGPKGTDRRAFAVQPCLIAPVRSTASQKSARVKTAARAADPGLPTQLAALTVLRAGTGGVEDLRRQWPLPETADELCQVAAYTQATSDDVILGAAATETRIKALSDSGQLAEARVVHFATHGLLAGETAMFQAGKVEPSLLLTPPANASDIDDGLLTASEVANLRFGADWVILSACNTASGDDIGAEALSGLTRAFFYAGARSLLVSHWAVDSQATVKLITAAFGALAREPRLTQGQALAKAMTVLIDGSGRDAHPANWAPFIVVGGNAPKTMVAPIKPARSLLPAKAPRKTNRAAKPGPVEPASKPAWFKSSETSPLD